MGQLGQALVNEIVIFSSHTEGQKKKLCTHQLKYVKFCIFLNELFEKSSHLF